MYRMSGALIMGKIYCIIGKSGTGKDTVLAELLKNSKLSITKIVPYTTRPQREGEVEGVNYHYVSKFELNQMEAEGKVIEKRSYNTVHGEWIYFTASNNIDDEKDYIIITTQKALYNFFEYFGVDRVHVIYLTLDNKLRLERCINRESEQLNPNYTEVCRRYIADESDFDEDAINGYTNRTIIDTSDSLSTYTDAISNVILSNKEVIK